MTSSSHMTSSERNSPAIPNMSPSKINPQFAAMPMPADSTSSTSPMTSSSRASCADVIKIIQLDEGGQQSVSECSAGQHIVGGFPTGGFPTTYSGCVWDNDEYPKIVCRDFNGFWYYSQHTSLKARFFACGMCNERFQNVDLVKNHFQSHKEPVYPSDKSDGNIAITSILSEQAVVISDSEPDMTSQCENMTSPSITTVSQPATLFNTAPPDTCSPRKVTQSPNIQTYGHKMTSPTKEMTSSAVMMTSYPDSSLGQNLPQSGSSIMSSCGTFYIKYVDNGRKCYFCSLCSKQFRSPTLVATHYRTHTGEKPYKCSKCDKSFSQLGNMKRHESQTHSIDTLKCDVCMKIFSHRAEFSSHVCFPTEPQHKMVKLDEVDDDVQLIIPESIIVEELDDCSNKTEVI